ncbi:MULTISPECIES: hypothetical protein [unclassified Nonomuraea]|uniref:MmyB family transcriptional regulator n=1 Tax=unclassified Nonomuraea TaxID=2593643 RepID=UPI0033BFD405
MGLLLVGWPIAPRLRGSPARPPACRTRRRPGPARRRGHAADGPASRPSPPARAPAGLAVQVASGAPRCAGCNACQRRGLVWNELARLLIADFLALAASERNMARLIFLDEAVHHLSRRSRSAGRSVRRSARGRWSVDGLQRLVRRRLGCSASSSATRTARWVAGSRPSAFAPARYVGISADTPWRCDAAPG